MRQRPLVADAKPLQGEGEDPGREDRFVVGTDSLRPTEMLDGIQQQSKDGDGRTNAQRMKRQHPPAAMIEDAQQRLRRLWFDTVLGDVDRPYTIHSARIVDGVGMALRPRSPLIELTQELRNVGLAD